MFTTRVMTALVLGAVAVGCQQQPKPRPSSSLDASDTRASQQRADSYRGAHPGSEVGVVNAVIPDRHIVSVAGLPLDRIKSGDVVTLLGAGQQPIQAVVYDQRAGYTQARYQPLPTGTRDPGAGDLAVWYPSNTGASASVMTPDRGMPATSEPGERAATMPMKTIEQPGGIRRNEPGAATQPAAPAPPTTGSSASEPSATVTPTAPPASAPASKPAVDFNK